jgi:hypothetical protein
MKAARKAGPTKKGLMQAAPKPGARQLPIHQLKGARNFPNLSGAMTTAARKAAVARMGAEDSD